MVAVECIPRRLGAYFFFGVGVGVAFFGVGVGVAFSFAEDCGTDSSHSKSESEKDARNHSDVSGNELYVAYAGGQYSYVSDGA